MYTKIGVIASCHGFKTFFHWVIEAPLRNSLVCVSGPFDRAALGERSQSPAAPSSPAASSWEVRRMICPGDPAGLSHLQHDAVSDSMRRLLSPRHEVGLKERHDVGTK